MDWFLGLRVYQQVIVVAGFITILKFGIQDVVLPLFRFIKAKFWQLKVKIYFLHGGLEYTNEGKYYSPVEVILTVYNRGQKPVYIRAPKIMVLTDSKYEQEFGYPMPNDKYPERINSNDEYTYTIELGKLYDDYLGFQKTDYQLAFDIETTKGTSYRSNKLPREVVEDYVEIGKPKEFEFED